MEHAVDDDSIMDLYYSAVRFVSNMRGVRKPVTENIFRRIMYIPPESLRVVNYIRKKPHASFNPGALIKGSRLLIFPRLVFDYYAYVSSIGVFELELSRLEANNEKPLILEGPIDVRIILYPTEYWEMKKGCEDPRVIERDNHYRILYTGVSPHPEDPLDPHKAWSYQGYALLDQNYRVLAKSRLIIKEKYNDKHVSYQLKDSAFLRFDKNDEVQMLIRPTVELGGIKIEVIWSAKANLASGTIYMETLKPTISLEPWELKVGTSTNAVKIGSDEYIVGWHGVLKHDLFYREGLAVVNGEGELLGITNYVLEPRDLIEIYGDRPGVVFGNGLVLHKDRLYWIGGISDYAIGIFETTLQEVFEKIIWISKR